MATTVSPIKILTDLGLNPWEIENDEDYLRALKEGIITIEAATKGKGDKRSVILREELIRVRKGPKKTQVKEKKSTIKGAKLLPGRGNFNADDIKPVDVEKKEGDAPALMPDRLDNIANTVDSIALLLRRQFKLETKQQRDAKIKQDKDAKDSREDDLEKKPKDKKTGLIPNAIKKPALNFFEKLKRFFLNIVIGAGAIKLMEWLKDPANAEKITKFKDFLINNAGWILGGLAAIALLPIALSLVSVVQGILAGLSLLGPLLPALPWILGGLLVGAVAWWIGKKIKKSIVGGEGFSKARDDNLKRLEAHGIKKSGLALDPDTGEEIYVKRWEGSTGASGDDKYGSIEGRPWGPGDKGRNDSVKINLREAEHQKWYSDYYGSEKLKEKLDALNLYDKTKASIIEKKDEMHDKLRETVHVGGSIEKERESMDNPEWAEIMSMPGGSTKNLNERKKRIKVFRKETARLEKLEREKIEKNYGQEALNIQKNSSSATIDKNISSDEKISATVDKNLKKETNISPPNTKGNGGNTSILNGGGGGQQQSVGGGSGTGGSSTNTKFGSQDPNNYGSVSTKATYNLVGV